MTVVIKKIYIHVSNGPHKVQTTSKKTTCECYHKTYPGKLIVQEEWVQVSLPLPMGVRAGLCGLRVGLLMWLL